MRKMICPTPFIGIGLIILVTIGITSAQDERSFIVGEKDFEMDGERFQYVSGSFHYFRALRPTWESKLRVMKSAGLNVVDTYVEWAIHNPEIGEYDWENEADLVYFLELAQQLGFYVILRPGPYICAERDNGGLPYWLFTKYPNIKVRTSDADYLVEVKIWYEILFNKISTFLYGNGGNIIMVQVENEYGAFPACDENYKIWLKNETELYVEDKAVLFTTDIPRDGMECGIIEGVFATTDFGIDRASEMEEIWARLRTFQKTGPLVNSEFYPGWLTHWQEQNQRRDGDAVAETLRTMLQAGASVNFYMFFGGTNFGFTAGANDWGTGDYMADITSYDYDAPMDEAGDPTIKLIKIRNVINEYSSSSNKSKIAFSPTSPLINNIKIAGHPRPLWEYLQNWFNSIITSFFQMPIEQVPDAKKKTAYPEMTLRPIEKLLSINGRNNLAKTKTTSVRPLTFEAINQFSGLVLYETELPVLVIDPSLLTVYGLRDRAFIFIDDNFIGTLSRENAFYSLPISAGLGSKLQILVENQGRINFNVADDIKGILGDVTLQLYNPPNRILTNWEITGFPLTSRNQINNFIEQFSSQTINMNNARGHLKEGPIFFYGELILTQDEIFDTYLDPSGWGKGVLYVNGFNLGRYWPLVGPQVTMYIPAELLQVGTNTIVLLEYQKTPVPSTINFTTKPKLDGRASLKK